MAVFRLFNEAGKETDQLTYFEYENYRQFSVRRSEEK